MRIGWKRRLTLVAILWLAGVGASAQESGTDPRPQQPKPDAGAYSWTYGPFAYDPSGNIVAIGSDYFVYDPMGRLTSASMQRPEAGALVQAYEYDAYGNRTKVTTAGMSTSYPASSATNRLTAATYDAAGNVTQWAPPGSVHTRTYTYDALNMMTKEAAGDRSVVHIYTADDERLWSQESGTSAQPVSHWTVRDLGGKVLRDFTETGGTWQLHREYVYRDGQLLAVNTSTGTQHYSLDHLGTPRLITDGNRNKIFQHYYLPFGEEWTVGGEPADGSTLRFTGHERDDDLRGEPAGTLDYMHARFYSPGQGRFVSPDPVFSEWTLEMPQAWNRYAYVMNNPLKYTDPTGREMKCHTITHEDGTTEQICSEEIDVEAEEPEVERVPSDPSWIADAWSSITHEAENLKYLSWRDAPILRENRDVPCKSYGDRFLQSFAETNGLPGLTAPTGLGIVTAGKTAKVARGITPFQWARAGFGGATLNGTAFTAAETGVIAGATTLTNFALVTVAWEVGVAGGSAINAALTDGCM